MWFNRFSTLLHKHTKKLANHLKVELICVQSIELYEIYDEREWKWSAGERGRKRPREILFAWTTSQQIVFANLLMWQFSYTFFWCFLAMSPMDKCVLSISKPIRCCAEDVLKWAQNPKFSKKDAVQFAWLNNQTKTFRIVRSERIDFETASTRKFNLKQPEFLSNNSL